MPIAREQSVIVQWRNYDTVIGVLVCVLWSVWPAPVWR